MSPQISWRSIAEQALLYILYILPCTFILPIRLTNIFIVLLILIWLVLSVTMSKSLQFRFSKYSILPILYYGMVAVSLIYSDNLDEGFTNLETKLSILLFPVIFSCGYQILKNASKRKALLTYALSVTLVCLYLWAQVLFRIKGDYHRWSEYSFEALADLISVHPGYVSMYIGFAILILIVYLSTMKGILKGFVLLQILFLFFTDIRLMARTPTIALLICCGIYLLAERRFKVLLPLGFFTILTFAYLNLGNSDFKERVMTPFRMLVYLDWKGLTNYAYDRGQIYSCSWEVIEENIWLGVGTGDADECLMLCYKKYDYWWVLSQRYNAHNEYFQTLIATGVMGGLLLVSLLLTPLFLSLRKSSIFVLFCAFFALCSLTESTMEVQKGVIFFSFFYSLFVSFAGKIKIDQND